MKSYIKTYAIFALHIASTTAFAADNSGFMLNAALDTQYRWIDNASFSEGFKIPDAALYISREVGNTDILLDLPFSTSATGNNFNFATDKAQAYIGLKFENGLRLRFGQFDGVLGVEPADSHERRLTDSGQLGGYSPTTHTGVLMGYDFNREISLDVIAANPHDQGTLNSDNLEFLTQLRWKLVPFNLAAGFRTHLHAEQYQSQINVILDTEVGSWKLAGEFDTYSEPSAPHTAMGFAAHAGYSFNDNWELGLRTELISYHSDVDDTSPTPTTYNDIWTGSFGPTYHFNKHVKFRADYTIKSLRLQAGEAASNFHKINLSAVFTL